MGSVPSGYARLPPCSQKGGLSRSGSEMLTGEYGVSTLARSAVSTRMMIRPRGTTGARLSAARRQCTGRTTGSVLSNSPVAMSASAIADTGIEIRVNDIDQQIHRDDNSSGEQHDGLHHWKITKHDPLVDQLANTGPGKDRFDQNRPRNQTGQIDGAKGQNGNKGITQGVFPDHAALWDPFNTRQLDKLTAHDIEHTRAQQPHHAGHDKPAQGKCRQHIMPDSTHPDR